ncbi:MAG: hypothetical protein ABIW38_05370 [Ferruginibacter sp.]
MAFFMAFLVPVLSFLPCADIILQEDKCNKEFSLEKPAHQHGETGDNDGCSPFCHCACCAGIAFQQITISFSLIDLFVKNISCIYNPAGIIHIASEVWQPPRIC